MYCKIIIRILIRIVNYASIQTMAYVMNINQERRRFNNSKRLFMRNIGCASALYILISVKTIQFFFNLLCYILYLRS